MVTPANDLSHSKISDKHIKPLYWFVHWATMGRVPKYHRFLYILIVIVSHTLSNSSEHSGSNLRFRIIAGAAMNQTTNLTISWWFDLLNHSHPQVTNKCVCFCLCSCIHGLHCMCDCVCLCVSVCVWDDLLCIVCTHIPIYMLTLLLKWPLISWRFLWPDSGVGSYPCHSRQVHCPHQWSDTMTLTVQSHSFLPWKALMLISCKLILVHGYTLLSHCRLLTHIFTQCSQ